VASAVAGMQSIVADAERIDRRARRIVQRSNPRWIRFLAMGSSAAGLVAGLLASLYFGHLVPGYSAHLMALLMVGFSSLSGFTALACSREFAALSRRADILSRALDAVPEARLIVTPDGRVGYANIETERFFPGGAETVFHRIEQAICDDGKSQAQFRRLRGGVSAESRATAMLSLRSLPTGGASRFELTSYPIAGYSGYSFWEIRDVTARYEVETAIRDERDRLSDLLDNAPIGFYSADGSGFFRFVNRTLAEWLGCTPSEIIASGSRLGDYLAAPSGAGPADFIPFTTRGGVREGRGEVVIKTRSGRAVPVWIAQNIIGAGDQRRTRSVVCDLTPERVWKAALKSSGRFRRCFANAPLGIALVDRFGRFVEANRAVCELFAATSQSLQGRELIGFFDEEDRHRIAAKLAAAAGGHTDSVPVEVRPTRPGDKTMVLFVGRLDDATDSQPSLRASLEADPEDWLTLHFIDVTEQKHLEIQFAQSQKMQAIGQLAGGVAHDFNNLLTAMIGFCDLLLLRSPPSDPSFSDIMQIKQNANRAASLVRQLLAFSRQQTLQPRILNVTDILYELRHLIQRLIGENIKLDVVHGRDLGFVKADHGQFEQVIINLAVNARDAMPNGGTLTIRTANVHHERELRRGHEVIPTGDYVSIEIADTGVGIPKGNLDRIFDPFFSTKELGSGTGLGLSTVYGIVKQTGGFVFVSSTLGRGTIFTIYLPRCEPPGGALPVRDDFGEVAVKDLTGQGTIMLVEDDDPVRIFGARALRNKGYRVIEEKSGESALAMLCDSEEKIDLLITDVVMPQMDGPTLVREVREIQPEMRVIFISGYTEDAFRQRLDSESGIDFLPKPFSLKQLAAKVREVLAVGNG
jgi:two-component system cell cycle sensor histidine kinase/response regulator CckA